MINKIKDILIILDLIFTIFAVVLQNNGNNNLSSAFFGISGFALVLAFICIIINLVLKSKNK